MRECRHGLGFDSTRSLGPAFSRMACLRSRDDCSLRRLSPRHRDCGISARSRSIVSDVPGIRSRTGEVRLSEKDLARSSIGGVRSSKFIRQRCNIPLHGNQSSSTADETNFDGSVAAPTQELQEAQMSDAYVLAIDAGTTGIRCRAVFADGRTGATAYREFTQHYPRPGWVEHDPDEIWRAVLDTFIEVTTELGLPECVGITNQRETVVAWNRATGEVFGRAIVWQDRRTADECELLESRGHLDTVRQITGLVLDPYFSGTKMAWILRARRETAGSIADDLVLGTVDSWILWNLTGGEVFATDPSNASRTMLFDIGQLRWSEELSDLIGVPTSRLADVRPSSSTFGLTAHPDLPRGIPISGIAGDQQAALFGQACFSPGMAKNTYGTGSFVLMNIGAQCPPPRSGLLSTVAWSLESSNGSIETSYAFEASIFVTGAAVQWLRDGLGIIESSSDIGSLAASVPDSGGVVCVPAFTGLGSPWWDPHARGAIFGITRGTTRAHLARAVIESMALQTRDAIEAMRDASGAQLQELRVDGGASVMDLLLGMQADQLSMRVRRPRDKETTSLGAAYLAGLSSGVWGSTAEIAQRWQTEAVFEPAEVGSQAKVAADALHDVWLRAVDRTRDWAQAEN